MAIIIFLLLILIFILFSVSALMGDESPTSKILLLVKQKRNMSYDEIRTKFQNEKLIKMRLNNLVSIGWIKKTRQSYFVLPKGIIIARIIQFYRKLLGWSDFG